MPRSSVRSAATVARIWSRLARPTLSASSERPLGVVEVAAQDVAGTGDVEEHRRQGVPGEVVQLAGDAPTLLGDRLLGERLAGLLELHDQRLLPVHEATDGEREDVGDHPRLPADVLVDGEELADHPRRRGGEGGDQRRPDGRLESCRHVQDHRHAEEQHRFEHLLHADDDEDRDDDEDGEHLGREPRQPVLEDEGDDGRRHDQQVERRCRDRSAGRSS